MARSALGSLWAEPRVPHPPVRVWRDWVLVAVLVPTAVLEALLRTALVWRPVALALAVVVVLALLWRRTHPLAVVVVAFGAIIAVTVASVLAGAGSVGLYTTTCVLVLPYSLVRWGSGREAVVGLAVIAVAGVLGTAADFTNLLEAVVGLAFLLLPAAVGASVRFQATSRLRELDQVKLREREQLARELHDTVAHHVSAIAIRAQAGRVVAASRPAAALDALEVIEAEASRTLTEMRAMVGALRQGDEPELGPPRGVADIHGLARRSGEEPRVDVQLSGDLGDLLPAVDAAVYRMTQESVTNALRHARNATRIDVRVTADGQRVRLVVADDGDGDAGTSGPGPGYGLVGMTERAALLGGTVEAGRTAGRGWTVDAVLPKAGPPR